MTKSLYAIFTAKPGAAASLDRLLVDLTMQVRAEPGNRRFVVYKRQDDSRAYHVDEIYADQAAFDAHIASAHCRAFNAAIVDLVEGGGSQVVFLDPLTAPAA